MMVGEEFEEILRKHPPRRWPFTRVLIRREYNDDDVEFSGPDSEEQADIYLSSLLTLATWQEGGLHRIRVTFDDGTTADGFVDLRDPSTRLPVRHAVHHGAWLQTMHDDYPDFHKLVMRRLFTELPDQPRLPRYHESGFPIPSDRPGPMGLSNAPPTADG